VVDAKVSLTRRQRRYKMTQYDGAMPKAAHCKREVP